MDNADLEKLKINPGRLVPKFKASTTEYTVTVGSAVEELKLSPLTCDAGASCTVKVRAAHSEDLNACLTNPFLCISHVLSNNNNNNNNNNKQTNKH